MPFSDSTPWVYEGESGQPADAVELALIAAAASLYGSKGYRETALAEVCDLAGQDEAALRARFASAEDLLRAAYRYKVAELRDALWKSLHNVSGGPDAISQRVLTTLFRYLRQHPDVARLTFVEVLQVGSASIGLFADQGEAFASQITALLNSLYEGGLPDAEANQRWLIKALVGGICALVFVWVHENYATPEDTLIEIANNMVRSTLVQWLGALRLDKKLTASLNVPQGTAYVGLGYVLPLVDYLRSRPQAMGPVMAALGLDEADLGGYARVIPVERVAKAMQMAQEITGDEHIGLHVGERHRLACLGLVGQLAMTCRTIGEALLLYNRFGALVHNLSYTVYGLEGGALFISMRHPDGTPERDRQQVDRLLAGVVALGRDLAGRHVAPLRVELPYPQPQETRELEGFFRCPLQYNAEEARCYFSAQLMNLTLPGSVPELRPVLEAEAVRQLHALTGQPTDADPRLAALKQYIATGLREGLPELATAAEALGTSPRNLQRLLESRGTNYSGVIDDVRRDLAVMRLKGVATSLAEVSAELGFGDQSSFNKAFKRWFNTTPGEYRKLLLDH